MVVWRESKLGDLFEIKHGFAFKGEHFSDAGDFVLLSPGNFREEGGLKLKGDKEKFYLGKFPDEYLLKTGDIVVAMTDLIQNAPILGSSARIPEDGRFLHNQRLGKIIDMKVDRVLPEFVYHLFNLPSVRGQIKGSATGSTVRHTAPSRIYDVAVSIPPLPTQQRIAGILSAYDELIENSQRRIKILETMARALYREWFVHFRFPGFENHPRVASALGEIPKGWEVGRLDDVLILQRGFDLPKSVRVEGAIPIIAATGVTGFHDEARVKAPGVVTGRSGTIGKVMYVQEDFWPLNTALWVKEFPKAEPLFAYFTLSSVGLEQFNAGAAVPTLNRNDIHGLETIVPPRNLQKRFQEIGGTMLSQTRSLELKAQNLRRTRDLLLPRLLSGQVSLDKLES